MQYTSVKGSFPSTKYRFGERQAVSKLQKWFLDYESSFGSAIVLHTANRNSFSHRKHDRIICKWTSKQCQNIRSKKETGSEYLRIHYLEWKLFIICKIQWHFLFVLSPSPLHIIHHTCILQVCTTFVILRSLHNQMLTIIPHYTRPMMSFKSKSIILRPLPSPVYM